MFQKVLFRTLLHPSVLSYTVLMKHNVKKKLQLHLHRPRFSFGLQSYRFYWLNYLGMIQCLFRTPVYGSLFGYVEFGDFVQVLLEGWNDYNTDDKASAICWLFDHQPNNTSVLDQKIVKFVCQLFESYKSPLTSNVVSKYCLKLFKIKKKVVRVKYKPIWGRIQTNVRIFKTMNHRKNLFLAVNRPSILYIRRPYEATVFPR